MEFILCTLLIGFGASYLAGYGFSQRTQTINYEPQTTLLLLIACSFDMLTTFEAVRRYLVHIHATEMRSDVLYTCFIVGVMIALISTFGFKQYWIKRIKFNGFR